MNIREPGLAVLLLVLLLWGGFLIYRTSFVAEDGQRYFCLFDDAMISMAYARNVVEGYGLNWARQGEPVEGFTHPLWLVPMVASNLLPVDLRLRSLPMQVLSDELGRLQAAQRHLAQAGLALRPGSTARGETAPRGSAPAPSEAASGGPGRTGYWTISTLRSWYDQPQLGISGPSWPG